LFVYQKRIFQFVADVIFFSNTLHKQACSQTIQRDLISVRAENPLFWGENGIKILNIYNLYYRKFAHLPCFSSNYFYFFNSRRRYVCSCFVRLKGGVIALNGSHSGATERHLP